MNIPRDVDVGIASPRQMRDLLRKTARGEHSLRDTPRLWMSVDALMRLLTPENRQLLSLIGREHPRSVSALAETVGRDQGNLSRTLAKLEEAGFVRMVAHGREKRPEITRRKLWIELDLVSDSVECV
jgi:predicted transcriptional regulator